MLALLLYAVQGVRIAVLGAHSKVGRLAVCDACFRGWSVMAVTPQREFYRFENTNATCATLSEFCSSIERFDYLLIDPEDICEILRICKIGSDSSDEETPSEEVENGSPLLEE